MSAKFWKTGTVNAFQTSLNGSIASSDETITLTATGGLQYPGVIVIDRQDGLGNNTPTKREYISYTGITGNQLTGCSRGVASSTTQAHSSGALVEEVFTTTHWNDLGDFLSAEHKIDGTHSDTTHTSVTLNPISDAAPTVAGKMQYDGTTETVKVGNGEATKTLADTNSVQTFENKTISGATNTISNIQAGSFASGAVTSGDIAEGTITNADIAANAAIAFSKLAFGYAGGAVRGLKVELITVTTGGGGGGDYQFQSGFSVTPWVIPTIFSDRSTFTDYTTTKDWLHFAGGLNTTYRFVAIGY